LNITETMRAGMVSLGCPKNQVDGEHILALLRDAGFKIHNDPGLCDVVVINTCGFIEAAKSESIENILEFCKLKEEGRIRCIVVTGCLAQRYRDELAKEIPEVDVILGLSYGDEIVDAVRTACNEKKRVLRYDETPVHKLDEGDRILTTLPFFAYLKIAEGCDNRCAYCAIPGIRGGFYSRKMETLVDEARALARNGVSELVLVAQDVTRYGTDLCGHSMLPELLRELCKIDGLRWIRLLYCYPDEVTDELIDVIASEPKVAKYIDIPLQHINDDILTRMNRRGDSKLIRSVIRKLRERVPGITLRTSLIAGLPGETKKQFAQLCEFVTDTKFDRLGCFAYSPEEGTPAASMPDQVADEERERRAEIINNLQMDIMSRSFDRQIGKVVPVVVEGYDRYSECFFGRSESDAPEIDNQILFTSTRRQIPMGEYVMVRLTENMDCTLCGEEVPAGKEA